MSGPPHVPHRPVYKVTKTYGHNLGLSACFRQPNATSHCREPHGYALEFKFVFSSRELNDNNWVIDFGSLKPIKKLLEKCFDHRTCLAIGDPALPDFQELYEKQGWTEPLVLPFVGCEGFAEWVFHQAVAILRSEIPQGGYSEGLTLESVECREHGANSAIFEGMEEI